MAGGPATAAKPISVAKLSARPEAGRVWAVTGLALHNSLPPSPAAAAAAGAASPLDVAMAPGLFVVTESQTLHFNLKTNTKVRRQAWGCVAAQKV